MSAGLSQLPQELIAAGELVQGYMCAAVSCNVHVWSVPHGKISLQSPRFRILCRGQHRGLQGLSCCAY